MEMKEGLGTEVIKDVMKREGMTHAKLAEALGYKSVSGVTGRVNTPRISTDRMVEFLNAMGYEVIVRKREEEGGQEWRVLG